MDWCKKAQEFGFEHVGVVRAQDLECLPEVRDMCAAGRCGAFGTRWTCPPGCGSLEECAARLKEYGEGVLVQSTGMLDDPFDADTMMETERIHKERFAALAEAARAEEADCLPLGAGTCQLCAQCTYPDAPCRFPQRAVISMEAFGLLVSSACERAGVPYYYGPNTITYTSCVLFHGKCATDTPNG
ncbi:DUF2284 domain-containing protein [Pseudoflavonifractor sp. DSM 107456]|uniref:DUF2284 domain-containing protein n=1 Tax=Pseudoflavonifractor gallinarum TaxID=2779352 RepID=A0ABR9RCM2_9FIRM|nr:DUF2284 domain-containing protein [Pseudoflavonifractor gallinarum]MBE5056447.1 DUF2284 domain-containing protein [Pseudoflavonifractor gallinarum]